jgi:hypothetical protein
MAEGWRSYLGTMEDAHVEADEYRVLDNERVLGDLGLFPEGDLSRNV